eukprot:COSAG05_NODE_16_length_35726_cov_813.577584_3_plen_79_part_00
MESYSSITTRLSLAHLPTLDPPGPWLEFDPKGGCYGKANVLLYAGTEVPNKSENSADLKKKGPAFSRQSQNLEDGKHE